MHGSLIGTKYVVNYAIFRRVGTDHSRGDHGMGGGEYTYSYWEGQVTVRDKSTGECLAACTCGIDRERAFRLSDNDIRSLLFGEVFRDEFLDGKEEAYTDLVGDFVINFYKADRQSLIPNMPLVGFKRELLEQLGIIPDKNEQISVSVLAR